MSGPVNSELLPGLSVSRETSDRLEALVALVQKWTAKINLVAPSTVPDLWHRHVIDSAQLYVLAPQNWRLWVDLGSGGGFPGIVIAAIAAQDHPTGHVTMIESDQRKAAFLRTCIRELGLTGTVLSERSEMVPPMNADVISARAFGPLVDILGHVERHLAPDGKAFLLKGRKALDEVAAARKIWNFDVVFHASLTDTEAQILQIESVARA